MGRKADKTGRSSGSEHFAMLTRALMQEPAWRALSSSAQALYPWLRLEWKGPNANNNGQIRFSVRQAAKAMGVTPDTATRAFHDLQAKGFIVVRQQAYLGFSAGAKGHFYELTEIEMPQAPQRGGRRLYRDWREGQDFRIQKAVIHNPRGRNGRVEACHENQDAGVMEIMTNPEMPS